MANLFVAPSIVIPIYEEQKREAQEVFKERKVFEHPALSPLIFEDIRNLYNLISLGVQDPVLKEFHTYIKHHKRV